jgi:signal transduction histidine kinase
MILFASKVFAEYEAQTVCKEIQEKINSGEADEYLDIDRIDELKKDNLLTEIWINGIVKNSIVNDVSVMKAVTSKIFVQIEINNVIVYSNFESNINEFSDFYSDTGVQKPIMGNSHFNVIGTVTVRVNPNVILPIVGIILIMILILSIIALILEELFGLFLIIPIIYPINQLDKKMKAIAKGDQETALNTHLVLKKPLKEIESLADSTNEIMNKLHGYNELLENQKETLENQNAELEVQNDELMKSKQQIEQQQAQLIQSEKMASVGLLTAAITHEINTPIGAINSNAQMSDMMLSALAENPTVQSEEELHAMLQQLKEVNNVNLMACSRIIEIIKSLKSFSRLDQAEFQEADINEGIKSVLILTNNLLKGRITIHEDYGTIPLVKCFPGQLNQVFMNIIVNASQAMEKNGELFIRTWQRDRDIYITIRDTGTGIKPEDQSKIFEPGFTTKGVGVGLGIGLYISYNIIRNHKGEISVTSEPDQGTEFTIQIPMDNDRT